jgi:hypothetical protein
MAEIGVVGPAALDCARARKAGHCYVPAAVALVWLMLFHAVSAQTGPPTAYLSHEQARPVFVALGEEPPSAAAWPDWIAASDRATRARVALGDETSVVNFLLFGGSFTKQPRVTQRQFEGRSITAVLEARLDDFEKALEHPGTDERLLFARRVLGDGPRKGRLLSMLDRVRREGETHARLVHEAEALGDPSLQFAERSRIYRMRGLSSDTSIRPNLAIDEALSNIYGTDAKRRVQRVAIIGPGLDFADKQEGHDFYPPQTIQPFAVMDSLIRLGVARADSLSITTIDVSASVNEHIEQATGRARTGSPYIIHLPLDDARPWTPALLAYWKRFGDAIGTATTPLPGTGHAGPLRNRAVRVSPQHAAQIAATDLNITAQYLTLPADERFDLVIGTNVFVYYDRLQQGLATVAVARMLRPDGVLLSNNALVEIPLVGLKSVGYSTTVYSSGEQDGDVIVWYRMADQ